MNMIMEKGREFLRNSDTDSDSDKEVPQERFKLQGELIRRQVEHELDGDSNEPLLYFFKASEHVEAYDIERFVESLSTHRSEAFVYRGDFEHISHDEMRDLIKDAAPEVGLSVEEVD